MATFVVGGGVWRGAPHCISSTRSRPPTRPRLWKRHAAAFCPPALLRPRLLSPSSARLPAFTLLARAIHLPAVPRLPLVYRLAGGDRSSSGEHLLSLAFPPLSCRMRGWRRIPPSPPWTVHRSGGLARDAGRRVCPTAPGPCLPCGPSGAPGLAVPPLLHERRQASSSTAAAAAATTTAP